MTVKAMKAEDTATVVELREKAMSAMETLNKFSEYLVRTYFDVKDEKLKMVDEMGNQLYQMSEDSGFLVKF